MYIYIHVHVYNTYVVQSKKNYSLYSIHVHCMYTCTMYMFNIFFGDLNLASSWVTVISQLLKSRMCDNVVCSILRQLVFSKAA